jgi:hypothetical protein
MRVSISKRWVVLRNCHTAVLGLLPLPRVMLTLGRHARLGRRALDQPGTFRERMRFDLAPVMGPDVDVDADDRAVAAEQL